MTAPYFWLGAEADKAAIVRGVLTDRDVAAIVRQEGLDGLRWYQARRSTWDEEDRGHATTADKPARVG